MPQVIHPTHSHQKKPSFSQQLLAGAEAALPGLQNYVDQRKQERYLSEENQALKERHGSNLEGIRDPTLRHAIVGEDLRRQGLKRQGEQSLFGKGGISSRKPMSESERETGRHDPLDYTIGGEEAQGRTPRRPQPVKSLPELEQEAEMITRQKLENGIEADYNTELANLASLNTAQKMENQEIEQKRSEYSDLYNTALSNVFPGATDEISILAAEQGEQDFDKGLTPAESKRNAVQFAKKLGNEIDTVNRTIKGFSKSFDKNKRAYENALEPLLKRGLYDTTRNILDKNNLTPEERESVIADLGEESKKSLARIPDFKNEEKSIGDLMSGKHGEYFDPDTGFPRFTPALNPELEEKFNESLSDVLAKDPSANLILLRQAYKDKGVSWEDFKRSIDEKIKDGSFIPTEEQYNALKDLGEPPHEGLRKLLKNIGII